MQPNCYGSVPGYGSYPGGVGGGGCGRCQTAYGCGQYGCYRMRARGSRSFQPGRERFRAMQEARRLEEGSEEEVASLPQRRISEMENLAFASETVAMVRRNPTARLVRNNLSFFTGFHRNNNNLTRSFKY